MLPDLSQAVHAPPRLPPLRANGAYDDLSPGQRRVMVGAIAGLHLAAFWGLLQVSAVRQAVIDVAPMFVDFITPPAPPAPPKPPEPPPPPRPMPKAPPPPLPVIAAAPSPAPATFTVPAPPPEPTPPAPPAPPVAVAAPPAPAPAPAPPPPRIIAASAVQFTEAPSVDYPRLSKRNSEAGVVVVRAYIDAAGGAARTVQIDKSSGFDRLDQAALRAVQRARFKAHTENGRPIEGWALIPINFELEK